MKRKLWIGAIFLFGSLGCAWVVLLEWSPAPEGTFTIDPAKLQSLAGDSGLPVRINAVLVGTSYFPAKVAIAGADLFDRRTFSNVVYQIVYGDGSWALIDTANDSYLHEKRSNGEFFPDAYARLVKAMAGARAIVITHEHFDHIGGISRSQEMEKIAPRVFLTEEQIHGPTLHWAEFPEGALERFTPLVYDTHHALLPGLVLIKAPGHTTGSQIVYARLKSGRQFLFVGDISWQMEGIQMERGKALLATLIARENRSQVLPQLVALHAVQQQTDIGVIVSHDNEQLKMLHESGEFGRDFESL
jgi:glyoxylase-like metal-dependent hydrolase (beta-lactamase superfamily II)